MFSGFIIVLTTVHVLTIAGFTLGSVHKQHLPVVYSTYAECVANARTLIDNSVIANCEMYVAATDGQMLLELPDVDEPVTTLFR